MKYKYNGTDERVFPSIGTTVKPGDEFDAPEGFVAANVTLASAKPSLTEPTEPKEKITMSAAPDHKLGDE